MSKIQHYRCVKSPACPGLSLPGFLSDPGQPFNLRLPDGLDAGDALLLYFIGTFSDRPGFFYYHVVAGKCFVSVDA